MRSTLLLITLKRKKQYRSRRSWRTRPRQNYRLKRVKSWRRQSRIFIELRRRKRTLVKQRRRRRPLKLRGRQRIVLVRRGKITRRKTRKRRNREINLGKKTLST